jgi:hypothetical protein
MQFIVKKKDLNAVYELPVDGKNLSKHAVAVVVKNHTYKSVL